MEKYYDDGACSKNSAHSLRIMVETYGNELVVDIMLHQRDYSARFSFIQRKQANKNYTYGPNPNTTSASLSSSHYARQPIKRALASQISTGNKTSKLDKGLFRCSSR